MDSVNSNPYFNPAHLRNLPQPAQTQSNSRSENTQTAPQAVTKTVPPAPYSNMFDDGELERLQGNLESIAELTGKALERIQKRG